MHFREHAPTSRLRQFGTFFALTFLLLTTLLLGACGGGSSSGSGNPLLGDNTGSSGNKTAAGDSSVTVSWVAPAQRTDGSPMSLSQIGGYKVYYGTASGDYTQTVDVPDSTATETVVDNLGSGQYYFAVRVYDAQGLLSDFSQEQSVNIN